MAFVVKARAGVDGEATPNVPHYLPAGPAWGYATYNIVRIDAPGGGFAPSLPTRLFALSTGFYHIDGSLVVTSGGGTWRGAAILKSGSLVLDAAIYDLPVALRSPDDNPRVVLLRFSTMAYFYYGEYIEMLVGHDAPDPEGVHSVLSVDGPTCLSLAKNV